MTAINFPDSPSIGQTFQDPTNTVWQYTVDGWVVLARWTPIWFSSGWRFILTFDGASDERLTLGTQKGGYAQFFGRAHATNPGEFELVAGDANAPVFSTLRGTVAGALTWTPASGSPRTVWHSGNQGGGSGLDADTVDGEHAAAIVTEPRVKAALAGTADLADTNVLALKQNCDITADGGGAGTIYSTSVKNSTTAAAANMVIDATGAFIQRSTSSRRYKKNIRSAKFGLREVLKLRPVTYQGRGKLDGDKVHAGLIAEEVFEAGLHEFVTMKDGRPESLAYGHMVALLAKAMQEQQAMIDELKRQLGELGARGA